MQGLPLYYVRYYKVIRNLASKIETLSKRETVSRPAEPAESVCRVIETRESLGEYPGLAGITGRTLEILCGVSGLDMRRCLFVDTETTGLGGGSVAFLIGMGMIEDSSFVVRQLLMRDYDEEESSLSVFADMLEDAQFLVSYNGKSFDVPLLRARFTINRLRGRFPELPHVDLLHASRRIWKRRLGGCSQKRIEEESLGMVREDDLPGSEVPKRYFEYLKEKDESLLEDILRHNAKDVHGMARIISLLAGIYENPASLTDSLDMFSLCRSFEMSAFTMERRRNNPSAALYCADMAISIAIGEAGGEQGGQMGEMLARLERRKKRLLRYQ